MNAADIANMNSVTESIFNEVRANADITLYNRYADGRGLKYQRTQIEAVLWTDKKAANVLSSGGNIEADQASILIPFSRGEGTGSSDDGGYIDPIEWAELADKTGYWTLQPGDYIVRGLVEDDISEVSDSITPAFTISDLKRTYDEVLTITSVDAQDFVIAFPNWKVGAK